jgi:hypothetical protein
LASCAGAARIRAAGEIIADVQAHAYTHNPEIYVPRLDGDFFKEGSAGRLIGVR